ncbi:MAG: DEAD/DEAH box helicase [Methylotenera sp.]|nr:DEAD/DEAH box helicase [Methylotenera sp.]
MNANPIYDALKENLQTGFIDHTISSNKIYLPQFLVNDKVEGKKILSTIIHELNSCEKFWFSVAFVTTSGVAALLNTLLDLEKRGIHGTVLVSQYLNFTQPEALKKLLTLTNIKLKIVIDSEFHAKGYLFKKREFYNLIIGSSNLTSSALSSNKEWNLKISATFESDIIHKALKEFESEFQNSTVVDENYLTKYEEIYKKQHENFFTNFEQSVHSTENDPSPNNMQKDALQNITKLREKGKIKALLISATGTGKTYLSAFDVKEFNPNKFLFIVHRTNIAQKALDTFKSIFHNTKTMGMYSGNRRELDKDFIFSTIQTISRPEHLNQFDKKHFDYIVIDESHHAGADSYQNILNHFNPKFLLGMTATPERTDGLDIFSLFDHNIAYEIRLHKALDEGMLSPFHYYGIADISVDGELLNENEDFSVLTSNERIKHIIEKTKLYGCDNGVVRGLIFCSSVNECNVLSEGFNQRGFRTIALNGSSTESDRNYAINKLEADFDDVKRLDYIFTVDIFNEGIDIPKVNQVIMLRPTQSAIVFIQQLGRGLRKIKTKDYLTVIDFIGNYNNTYLVPIALYGDTSYNKDSLRKLMSGGSSLMPGSSTINFDVISRDKIFDAINSANMQLKKDLVNDYKILKFQLGRIPMMLDHIEHGLRDPQLYVNYSDSYFNFVKSQEKELQDALDHKELNLLKLFSNEICNSKRVEECLILMEIIKVGNISIKKLETLILEKYFYKVSLDTIESCVKNLNFEFVTEKENKQLKPVREIYKTNIVEMKKDNIVIDDEFSALLTRNETFTSFLLDSVEYSIKTFNQLFDSKKLNNGFILYRKYSRKDVFRILNWNSNPVAQNVGGYIISADKSNCPIFVNYHKEDAISNSTKYEDHFISNDQFAWMSKSKRTLNSPDVKAIKEEVNLRMPLFIKKSNDEGAEFYYMGDMKPIPKSFEQASIPGDDGKNVSVVKVKFSMNHPVEDSIYNYIIDAS